MEWNGGVAVLLFFLLSILIVLLIPVMLMTLMLCFHIYRCVKNDLNLEKREEKIEDSDAKKEEAEIEDSSSKKDERIEDSSSKKDERIEDSSSKKDERIEDSDAKKEEAEIGNSNVEKAEDIIKKKEEVGGDGSEKGLTINICINLPRNDDERSIIASVEGAEIEEDNGISKSTVYSGDSIKGTKDVKNDLEGHEKEKPAVVTKKSDMKQLPDFSQSQELDKQIINKESNNPDSKELKSNTKQVSNSLQSHDLNKSNAKNKEYVSASYRLDTSELEEINKDIAAKGYEKWLRSGWERIWTGDEKHKIGDEVVLQYGDGNIRVANSKNEMYYIGVPAKAQWKGCDFDDGAFKVCYDVVSPVEGKMDYDIVRFDKLARLRLTGEKFELMGKGKIQVKQVSSTN